MKLRFRQNPDSDVPVYRQLADYIRDEIVSGRLPRGGRVPSTRQLAEEIGLNRATIAAAFEHLEEQCLIRSFVGRGSFVTGQAEEPADAPAPGEVISFAAGKPAGGNFPLDMFRLSCDEVLAQKNLESVLQLGSSYGLAALRRYLMDQARAAEIAGPEDEILVTSGCQQALDLLQRVLIRPGDAVAVEDPVYPGLKQLFASTGARLIGIPMTDRGLALDYLERAIERDKPKMLLVTPNFQNPTGVSLGVEERTQILGMAHRAGMTLVENDTYAGLRYSGQDLPGLKALGGEEVVLLRTFSKVSFPGLRVGWVVGPRALLARLAEAKRCSDLHSDNLSQAIMLRFAESGRLEAHIARLVKAGREQLRTLLAALKSSMPEGCYWSEPEGGMNLWLRLPEPLDAGALLERASREGVAYTPGRYFEVTRSAAGALRLSFAGLGLEEIRVGVETLGRVFKDEAARSASSRMMDPSPILV